MSAVPARPSSPERCSSAVAELGRRAARRAPRATGRGPDRRCPDRVAIDEALERREAHRRVHRPPVAHGGQRCAGTEVAGHDPKARSLGRPRSARVARRDAYACDSPWNPYRRIAQRSPPRRRAARRSRRPPAASRGTRCRSRRRPGHRQHRAERRRSPASDSGWWSGRGRSSARDPLDRRVVEPRPASMNRVPPWTIRWPTASTGPRPPTAARDRGRIAVRLGRRRRSVDATSDVVRGPGPAA